MNTRAKPTDGDMLKKVYDPDDDGKVVSAEKADTVPWTGITGKPEIFPPSAHKVTHAAGQPDALAPADIGAADGCHTHTQLHDPALLGTKTIDESAIGDGKVIKFDKSAGKLVYSDAGTGSGDMTAAVYDKNSDGKVNAADSADSVPWTGITGKPEIFPPSAHKVTHAAGQPDALAPADIGAATAGHTHTQLHDPALLGTKTIDESAIGDGKVIKFDQVAGKLVYSDPSAASGGITSPSDSTRGDILFHNGTTWTRLPAGGSGQFLKTFGAGANPAWAVPPSAAASGIENFVSVKASPYNAVGDGAADDTAAINNAIAATSNSGGGTVYLPDGTYKAVLIQAKSNVTLLLAPGAVIKAPGNLPAVTYVIQVNRVDRFSIIGGTIDGNRSGTSPLTEWRHGIGLQASTNVLIRDVYIKDCGGDGIYLADESASMTYSTNVTIMNVMCDNNARQGISIIGVDNCLVLNCVLKNSNGIGPKDGIDIEPNRYGTVCRNIKIIGCEIHNNAGNGVEIMTYNTELHRNIIIRDCRIYNNTKAGFYAEDSRDVTVDSCDIYDNGQYGIVFTMNTKNPKIINNRVKHNGWYGIFVLTNADVSSWKRDSNNNLLATENVINVFINGNTVKNNIGTGIAVIDNNTAAKIKRVSIMNNVVFDDQSKKTQTDPLKLTSGQYVFIAGNEYYDNINSLNNSILTPLDAIWMDRQKWQTP